MENGRCPRCGEPLNLFHDEATCDGQQGKIEAAQPKRDPLAFPVNPYHNVRASDPNTSMMAALLDPVGRQTIRKRVARALKAAGLRGLTDYELADLLNLQQNSVGKRRGELRDEGFVRDSGETRKGPSGSPCIVWIWVGGIQ